MNRFIFCLAVLGLLAVPHLAQTGRNVKPRVEIAFNRFYDHGQLTVELRRLVAAYPDLLTMQSIGKSYGGRDMWLVTVLNKATGAEADKAAIWIDANVHGNEVQGSEVVLYTLWYLMENYGKIERITQLVDRRVFYCLPMVNPDGRDHWFHGANTSSSSRTGIAPIDDDGDGLFDEDGPDDLDGDGSIVQMRKKVERGGTHKLDPDEPRRMIRVKPGEEGVYVMLGQEGVDNDGDGLTNEDGIGGYDMNRNDPTDWQPNYVQFGAGTYPLCWPETRCIADFILAHPNIAAVQSYHNSGGMILRGPGAATVPEYPAEDLAVYDKLGRDGEFMLPFYRYMVIHKDLYTVHGGFVNWTAEGLGIVSFTNELWADPQFYGKAASPGGGQDDGAAARRPSDRLKWDDLVMLGAQMSPWKPAKHPIHGDIEIGGWSKYSERVPPAFMLEELCHRNAAFTFVHAEAMPDVSFQELGSKVEKLGEKLYRVRVELENKAVIPTRTALAAERRAGLPDFLTIRGAKALAAGIVRLGPPKDQTTPIEGDPSRLRLERGIGSQARLTVEWLVDGPGPFEVEYVSQKGGTRKTTVK